MDKSKVADSEFSKIWFFAKSWGFQNLVVKKKSFSILHQRKRERESEIKGIKKVVAVYSELNLLSQSQNHL